MQENTDNVAGAIPTMLTIQQTSDKSNIPYERIRQWCLNGKIVFKWCGSKRLINWEKFVDFLNTPD